jgi:NitT/TauT family transport system ATP-binding protein
MKILLQNICFSYSDDRVIFREFCLDAGGNFPVMILGPSGCGKTTLLKLIAGLLKPQKGEVIVEGDASFVFQEPRLIPGLTVLRNVALPIEKTYGKAQALEKSRELLDKVSLGEKAGAFPAELSGGQKQRASLARAFAYPAPLLLMDEPFQGLDIPLRQELLGLTVSLLESQRHSLICVTHDPKEAAYLGRRILVLNQTGDICLDETQAAGSVHGGALEDRITKFMGTFHFSQERL